MACCDDCAKSGGSCGSKSKTTTMTLPAGWSVGGRGMRVGADPQYPTVAEQNAYNQGKDAQFTPAFVGGMGLGVLITSTVFTLMLFANRGKVLR